MYNVYFKILLPDGGSVWRRYASLALFSDVVIYLLCCVHGAFRVVDTTTRNVIISHTNKGKMISSSFKKYVMEDADLISIFTNFTEEYVRQVFEPFKEF